MVMEFQFSILKGGRAHSNKHFEINFSWVLELSVSSLVVFPRSSGDAVTFSSVTMCCISFRDKLEA